MPEEKCLTLSKMGVIIPFATHKRREMGRNLPGEWFTSPAGSCYNMNDVKALFNRQFTQIQFIETAFAASEIRRERT